MTGYCLVAHSLLCLPQELVDCHVLIADESLQISRCFAMAVHNKFGRRSTTGSPSVLEESEVVPVVLLRILEIAPVFQSSFDHALPVGFLSCYTQTTPSADAYVALNPYSSRNTARTSFNGSFPWTYKLRTCTWICCQSSTEGGLASNGAAIISRATSASMSNLSDCQLSHRCWDFSREASRNVEIERVRIDQHHPRSSSHPQRVSRPSAAGLQSSQRPCRGYVGVRSWRKY